MKKRNGFAPVVLLWGVLGAFVLGITAWYEFEQNALQVSQEHAPVTSTSSLPAPVTSKSAESQAKEQTVTTNNAPKTTTSLVPSAGLDVNALLALADNTYASGNVPLGDNKYVTSGAKKGYIYLCNVHTDNFGAQSAGSWIHGSTWNFLEKISVAGSVSWPEAQFSNIVKGTLRVLSGNGLPIGHATGKFPVASNDPAYAFDRNPNSIKAHAVLENIPANPVFSNTPYCTGGGEIGVMLSGIPLFNGFDAGLRDAPAHELQDACDGHPQESGAYHYHSLSKCFKDESVSTVLGYALDGFPITGPLVAKDKYLTTDDLDVCHGITSDVMVNGTPVMTYHYVMTQDFPYSISCFRSKPVSASSEGGVKGGAMGGQQVQQGGGGGQMPPQEAITACSGKVKGSQCNFVTPRGDSLQGTCDTPPGSQLACVPAR